MVAWNYMFNLPSSSQRHLIAAKCSRVNCANTNLSGLWSYVSYKVFILLAAPTERVDWRKILLLFRLQFKQHFAKQAQLRLQFPPCHILFKCLVCTCLKGCRACISFHKKRVTLLSGKPQCCVIKTWHKLVRSFDRGKHMAKIACSITSQLWQLRA